MTRYLISFPGTAMDLPEEDFQAVGDAAHAVVREAKAAGVYLFSGGFTVLELGSRDEALAWAEKIAVACRCPQEVREWQYDPQS